MNYFMDIALLFDQLYQKLGRQYANLTRPQRRFLHAIAKTDGIGVTTLAEYFEMTVAGATRMLDKLESANLIERRRQTEDARQVKVYLTANGDHELTTADAAYYQRLKVMLAPLTESEQQLFLQLLNKFDLDQELTGH